jgi:hypothetical protein
MYVEYLGKRLEVPEHLITSYIKDFEGLPGSGQRNSVLHLRNSIYEVFDYLAEDPEALEQYEYRRDFVKAWAVYKALEIHGLLLDS